MADALLPAFAMAAGVLLFAGLAKLRSPAPAQLALGSFALPPKRSLARAVGGAEALIGGACLVAPAAPARLALAAAYVALAGGSTALWLRGDRRVPCGCFGDAEAWVHTGHVALNLCFAAVAAIALLIPPVPLPEAVVHAPAGPVLIAGIACAVYLCLAFLSLFADAWHAFGGEDA
jgi:hypothetical protein